MSQPDRKTFAVNGREQKSAPDSIFLTPGENQINFEFPYYHNDSVSYQYKIDGLGSAWHTSKYPIVNYNGLVGGHYAFHFRAVRDQKVLAFYTITISKENAFWNNWWFIPMIVFYIIALIGVGIYLFLLYDFRQKLRVQNIRNQIAADLHDEVGSNLNSIAIFVEVLRKNAPTDMYPILDKIITNSKESVGMMQDTVWTINPRNDTIPKLFDRMKSFAAQIFAGKGIAFDFTIRADLNKVDFSMDQRKNMYLIFKEVVNNIVKHSEATHVQINTEWKDHCLEVVIQDNGKGFDTNLLYEGNGLYNLSKRAAEAEFVFSIESKTDCGTKVRMAIDP